MKGTKKALYFHSLNENAAIKSNLDELFQENVFNIFHDNRTKHKDNRYLSKEKKENDIDFIPFILGVKSNCASIFFSALWIDIIRHNFVLKTPMVAHWGPQARHMKQSFSYKTGIRLLPYIIKNIILTKKQRDCAISIHNKQSVNYVPFLFQIINQSLQLISTTIVYGDQIYFKKINQDNLVKPLNSNKYQNEIYFYSFLTRIPLYNITIDMAIRQIYSDEHISELKGLNAENKIDLLINYASTMVIKNPQIVRYWFELYLTHKQLQNNYPDIIRNQKSREKFVSWINQYGKNDFEGSSIIASNESNLNNILFGVTLYGYLKNVFGVAEIARNMAEILTTSNIPFSLYPLVSDHHKKIQNSESMDYWEKNYFFTQKSYQINIFMVNADLIPKTIQSFSSDFFNKKYKIGCWFWEVEDFFPFHEAIEYVDEIWGFSDFCCSIFQKYTSKTVHKITFPFYTSWNTITDTSLVRKALDIDPHTIVFFFNFDFHSCFERKNPIGIIKAFLMAFPIGTENVALIIKSIHAEKYIEEAKRLQSAVQHDSRIMWINQSMSKDELISLLNASDCYISLHRSEGLGIGMIEAMYLGKCVIATRYGGNLDFMNDSNSILINYSYIEIENDFGPYKKGYWWADPSLDQASMAMESMYNNHIEYRRRYGGNASKDIKERYRPENTTNDILHRIHDITKKES
jgi:glycosyltransferase involved in cell wall biosynthesis